MSTQLYLSPQTIQTLIQQYFTAIRSDNKAESMVACFAEDGTSCEPVEGPALQGHTELRQFYQGLADLFAEVELTEDFISINGNEAAVKWTGRGVGKNGRAVTFEGIDVFEFNPEGKIQSLRGYWNPAAMIAQLQRVG